MNDPDLEPTLPAYKDRSVGLVIFGILTLLLGCLAGLFVPLIIAGQAAAAKSAHLSGNNGSLLPVVAIYGGLAVALIWLGIGSIMCRRWARALLLIFSWSWLVMGFVIMAFMAFILQKMLDRSSPAGTPAPNGAVLAVLLVFGFLMVLLPAAWTFFYGSRHVKATCEARDPVIRWTDACPLPVLALCVWGAFSGPIILIMPLAGHGVMPFFGTFLTGFPSALFCSLIAAAWICGAWLSYRLKPEGWWLILAVAIVGMVSALVTYLRHDIREMYQLMGYRAAEIDRIQSSGFTQGNHMTWIMVCSFLPFLVYLLFVKRYFRSEARA